jgi:integrase
MSAAPASQPRRLTRGTIEQRGSVWWNRYRAEYVDQVTGVITVGRARMRLGEFRSAVQASIELDRYLALLSASALQPGVAVTAREAFARFDRLRIALMRGQSRRSYRGIIRNHLEPALGHLPLSAIDANCAQELVARLHAKGLSRATVETVRNRLLEILQYARSAGFAAHDIRRKVVKVPSEQKAERERRYITVDELTRILDTSEGARQLLWAILGFAGLRIGEALGLTWENVDSGAGVLRVRQAATAGELAPLKTRAARRDVPILHQLEAILAEHRKPSGLLFHSRTGRPLRGDDVRRRWLHPVLKRLGIPKAGCHAFRHGLPGRLDTLGLSPAAIQRFMGHASSAQTEHYTHRSTADLREQLDAAERRNAPEQEATP